MNKSKTEHYKIAIVGAGIMGRLLAWRLLCDGHKITLFDKDPVEQGDAAAFTAAGMLTPFSEIETAESLIFEMGMQSLTLWPDYIEQWQANVGYQNTGSLIVAHGSDRADLRRFNQRLFSQQNLKPLIQHYQCESLNAQQLQQKDPELAERFDSATFLANEAWLSPTKVMAVLAEKLQQQNIQWHSNCFIQSLSGNKVNTSSQSYSFDKVFDCRGIGAKTDWSTLRAVRGEIIQLYAPEVSIKHLVRLMHPRYRLYLVPQSAHHYLIGATQLETESCAAITVRSCLELLSAAYSLHSGFAEANLIDSRVNVRPALNDNLPKVLTKNSLIRINGLFRHGFLLAPTIAEEISYWLQHNKANKFATLFCEDK
jgi:glycine oxidase